MRELFLAVVFTSAIVVSASANSSALELDALFRDGMVLPRHKAVISGHAGQGDVVTLSLYGKSWTARADQAGYFSLALPDFEPGLESTLTVATRSGQRLDLEGVVTGDVYLCSGQSNMQVPITRALNTDVVIASSSNDNLRMATVAVDPSPVPRDRLAKPVAWQKASPQTISTWSASCYFFGESLQRRVKIPIGLVHASLGGSNLTAWLSPGASLPDYQKQQDLLKLYAIDGAKASIAFGKEFQQWWKATGGQGAPWATSAVGLGSWPAVPDASKHWEKWGLAEFAAFDGALWYATTFRLTQKQAEQAGSLDLGLIDEIDTTWLNGKPIGFTSGASKLRHYSFPAGALRAGDNTIVLNVVDLWSFGGLYGDQPRQVGFADGSQLPLTGWHWQSVPQPLRFPPRAPWDAMAGISVLYNGMIAPLKSFAFKGTVWYQGESNIGQPYQGLLTRLFKDWRHQFGDDMLFAVVQLANFGARAVQPVESAMARLREEQRLAVLADGNAVLATAVDLGEPTDVHPANKNVLGDRVARAVAIKLYDGKGSSNGPMVMSAAGQGETVAIDFSGIEGDLVAYGAARPIGFEVCSDAGCRWAEAKIEGRRVVLANAGDATKVRFCWADAPTCTLYDNQSGLPALPFEQVIQRKPAAIAQHDH